MAAAAAGSAAGAGAAPGAYAARAQDRAARLQQEQQREAQRNADIQQQLQQLQIIINQLRGQLALPNVPPQQQILEDRLRRAEHEFYYLQNIGSQHLFRVINEEIKHLISRLKDEAKGGHQDLNHAVKETVKRLEIMGENVDDFEATMTKTTEILQRPKQVIENITNQTIRDFINADKATNDGVLSAAGKTINLETLNTDLNYANRLETEEEANVATETQIKTRLSNCQYLEILYLTKHDELMKIFRFTLSLYDKYTYAIKILLFVLKNLLEQRPCPPPGPGQPPGQPPGPGQPPQIKLPKALIRDIKQLLKDQKQVQDVINRIKPIVDETVPRLVNEEVANAVSGPTIGSTIDDRNPPQP
jgi:hypothetical protein